MLKVFFDTLPPEDGKRLVTVVDNEGQTMLMRAAFCHRAPTVRYLLAKGADPSATDCYGQTIYAKLRVSRILPDAATEAISLLARLLGGGDGDMDDILAIFESTGVPGATDMDDYIHTAEELRDMEAIFGEKSDPNAELRKLAEQYSDPLLWLRFSTLMMESLDRCMSRTYTTNPFVWVSALRQSLGRWAESRNRGSIPLDLLPDGWAEIFAEVNKVSPGFWKDFILEEEEIPQITDVASRVAIWVLEKFLECNGLQILDKLADVLNELESSGSLKLITEQCSQVATDVAGISSRHRMTLLAKSSLLYRARKVWRSLSRGEVLDRLHDLAVAAGVDEKVDDIAQDLVAGLLGPWLPPPPTAHETLRLSERYPDTTIFVTAVTEHYISGRLALACVQFVVFLLPALALVVVGWAIYFMIRRGDEFALMILFLWIVLWPKEWVLVDENYHFHPSIWQGISAAAELLIFRLHHVPEPEEPLIVSLGRQPLTHVDVPSRMKVMPHGRMGTVYWLSLRRNGGPKPIPCYGAMRNLMSKWKKGEMPKKAWCEGWWELAANGLWARVDANGSPKWSEYCNASRNIKVSGCPWFHHHDGLLSYHWQLTMRIENSA
jgi:hypothetical protein